MVHKLDSHIQRSERIIGLRGFNILWYNKTFDVLQYEGCYKLPGHLSQSQSCDKYITSLGTSYSNAKAKDREKNTSLSFIIYTKIHFWNFISLKLQVVVDSNGDMKTKNKEPYRWNLMCLWVQLNPYVFIY